MDIHIGRDAAVETMADADISDVAAVIYDKIHFRFCLLRRMADLKFPGIAVVLLDNVAAGGRQNAGCRDAYHGHILHNHLAADTKMSSQILGSDRGFSLL